MQTVHLTDAFSSWTEIDDAIHYLGVALGLVPDSWQEARRFVEANDPVTRGLVKALLALVSEGALEANVVVEPDGVWQMVDRLDADVDFAFRRPLVGSNTITGRSGDAGPEEASTKSAITH